MGLELAKVHEYARIPGTGEMRLVRTRPAMRIRAMGEPPLWVQDGQVYTDGGQPVVTPPGWFWDEMERVSPETRQQHGLTLPAETPPPMPKPQPKPPAEAWTCPECAREMPKRARIFHAANHRRQAAKLKKEALNADGERVQPVGDARGPEDDVGAPA